ncbi:MAG TPA: PQQ-binding-like beta-propeller repeat protein, partial [Alphaproteobacteria bacterium]|nr:PQQ-binding-like beta-propeller repeat protein [Alphaproteobacteria bacterium]
LWTSRLPSPSRAAPTIMGDSVYVMTVDNRLVALDTVSGRKKWEYEGLAESAGLIGAASPAANSDIVVAPLSSGELTALRVENGSVAWSENLSSLVRRGGSASLPDIPGLPVIDKDVVIGVSYGGKVVSIEQRTGRRVWQREIGCAKSPWVVGNAIFFLSANAELVALGRDTGALLWVKPLNTYLSDSEALHNSLLWNGPIFAGGHLFVTAPEGSVIEVDPQTGDKLGDFDSGDRVAVSPVIADDTLFLLHQNGTLSAWK